MDWTVVPHLLRGKSYYILPDGPVGEKAYTLIHRAMEEDELHGIAQLVLAGREQLMLLRPVGDLLTLTDLHYAAEIREPSVFEKEYDKGDYKPNELAMAKAARGRDAREENSTSRTTPTPMPRSSRPS